MMAINLLVSRGEEEVISAMYSNCMYVCMYVCMCDFEYSYRSNTSSVCMMYLCMYYTLKVFLFLIV